MDTSIYRLRVNIITVSSLPSIQVYGVALDDFELLSMTSSTAGNFDIFPILWISQLNKFLLIPGLSRFSLISI